jgi:sodium-independent sulfate anion transporter 11
LGDNSDARYTVQINAFQKSEEVFIHILVHCVNISSPCYPHEVIHLIQPMLALSLPALSLHHPYARRVYLDGDSAEFTMGIGSKIANRFRQDENFSRARRGIAKGARGFGPGAVRYLIAKVPIVQWLPNYSPRWLIADLIAGQSVGLILIPQALMFSSFAGIPMTEGLVASWLPGVIYTIMGTSKGSVSHAAILLRRIEMLILVSDIDISVGPTSSVSLLTLQLFIGINKATPGVPAILIAAVVAFGAGLWSLVLGLLNLGFIFDFISLPLVLGFSTGISLIAIQAQVALLLGLVGIGPIFILQGRQILANISKVQPITIGLSVASLLVLFLLQFVGKKWGAKNELIRILSISRNIIVLGGMTLLSFILNKDLEKPLWAIVGPTSIDIPSPQIPNTLLLKGLLLPSATVFAAVALEHVALAKYMAHKNGYDVNASQELVSLGIANIVNSMIGGLPVGGGDIARASINSESGVKSPLSGLITTATVLLSMFAISGAIKWIPQPTIAAMIVLAVVETQPPMRNMAKFWKLSFNDFMGFLISFNLTLVAGAEAGVGFAFLIMVLTTLMRTMFKRPRAITRSDVEQQYLSESSNEWASLDRIIIPTGTQVISLETDIVYLNASRVKRHIIDTAYTHHSGKIVGLPWRKNLARSWDYHHDQHIAALRRKAGLGDTDAYSPRLRILVLDFSSVSFIDASGMQALQEVKTTLREYGGEDVDFRFVGLNAAVRKRFERARWALEDFRNVVTPEGGVVEVPEGLDEKKAEETEDVTAVKDLVFEILPTAILYQSEVRRSNGSAFEFNEDLFMQVKALI